MSKGSMLNLFITQSHNKKSEADGAEEWGVEWDEEAEEGELEEVFVPTQR